MYLNFNLLAARKITPDYILLLQAIRQKEAKWLEENCQIGMLKAMEEEGDITFIKPKNKQQSIFEIVRTTDKANKLLTDVQRPLKDPNLLILLDWLVNIYKQRGKEIGNTKRILENLEKFQQETEIKNNSLAYLFKDFLESEYVEENSNVLEYVLHYPRKVALRGNNNIAYIMDWQLEDSWLYKHYLSKEEYFKKEFKRIGDEK